ncbi:hypothetical protein HA402_000190 [Bradysia odoriphaga]|nr:hypothetical protein HA402_000190 [Bradysia odoriphaga]
MASWRKYVLFFAQEHVEFRGAEIKSLARKFNIPIKYSANHNEEQPFWLVDLPDDQSAKDLASRSVSLRCILELWGHSDSTANIHTVVHNYVNTNFNELKSVFEKSFRITVETYNKHITQKEKVDRIETFGFLPLKGEVNLKDPEVNWWYIEYYGLDNNNVPEKPFDIVFGKWLVDGRRSIIKDISLKTRKFIGNTSMDPQLSLLMANQALAGKGDLVFDPFVGSGSLLVAAAKFGAYVMGTDIDFLMLHAKTRPTRKSQSIREKDESIRANLRQYGCEQLYVDVLVSDFSNSIWNRNIMFDSIITDPPYGIREAIERVERKEHLKPNTITENDVHYPSTSHYNLSDLYENLLNFSAKHLKLGGRLVSWIPVFKNDYCEEYLPKHNSLQLVANSEQDISAISSRRLLTYEKVSEPCDEPEGTNSNEIIAEFRNKFFTYGEDTREERRLKQARLRAYGKQQAMLRRSKLDSNAENSSATSE